ncbi:MAG: c-type cytochrome biogenesis protein CcsB, partial [bacterium]
CEYKYDLPSLGSFTLPLASLGLIYASILPMTIKPLNPALQSYWLPIHAAFAFLGYASFALAFCVAIMYLLLERILKSKKIGPFYYRLPSLDLLDYIQHKSIVIGFPCLTLAIITGSMWANKAWGAYWSWDPKETWSLITWFIYNAIIHGRVGLGWRGKRASYLAIIGFLFVLFTFFGVNLLLSGLHSYV